MESSEIKVRGEARGLCSFLSQRSVVHMCAVLSNLWCNCQVHFHHYEVNGQLDMSSTALAYRLIPDCSSSKSYKSIENIAFLT